MSSTPTETSLRRLRSRFVRPPQAKPSTLSAESFRRIWLASTISDFGVYVSALALPLTAAVTLNATPFQMGLLTAIEWLPFVALGLVAGVVVDRMPRRALLVASDWLRAALLGVIPVLAIAGALRFEVLLAVAFGTGVCSLVFQVAQVSLLPGILPREDLTAANSRLEASAATTQATGPGLAGLLVAALSAPIAVGFNAASFALSGLILMRLPVAPEQASTTQAGAAATTRARVAVRLRVGWREIVEGLHVFANQPILRASLLASTTINLFGFVFLAVYILFMSRTLNLSDIMIGVILSLGGVGAVAGSLLSDWLRRRLGFGRAMLWAMLVCCGASTLIPLAFVVPSIAIPLLAVAELVQYGTLAIFNIGGRTLRQVLANDALQGRVNATARTLAGGGTLIGSLAGGLLGGWIGLGNTLIVGAVGMMLAIPIVLASPLGGLRDLPTAERKQLSDTATNPEPVATGNR